MAACVTDCVCVLCVIVSLCVSGGVFPALLLVEPANRKAVASPSAWAQTRCLGSELGPVATHDRSQARAATECGPALKNCYQNQLPKLLLLQHRV